MWWCQPPSLWDQTEFSVFPVLQTHSSSVLLFQVISGNGRPCGTSSAATKELFLLLLLQVLYQPCVPCPAFPGGNVVLWVLQPGCAGEFFGSWFLLRTNPAEPRTPEAEARTPDLEMALLQCRWFMQAGVLCYSSPVLSSECLAPSISPFYIFLYHQCLPLIPCRDFVLQAPLSVQSSARREENTSSATPAVCLAN